MSSGKDFLIELQSKGVLPSIDEGSYKVDNTPYIICWHSEDNQSRIYVRQIVVGAEHIRFEGPVFGVDGGYEGFIGFHKNTLPRGQIGLLHQM